MKGLLIFALAQIAMPGGMPQGFVDPRIQVVPYNPDQVLTLRVAMGYATMIELSPDEQVDSVVVGNSAGWQVTPNARGDRLIVKPLSGATTTDLIVMTETRRYVVLLEPGEGSAPFVVRYVYPQTAHPRPVGPIDAQASYRLSGDKDLFPLTMSDDGRRTRIIWSPGIDLPAIFAVDDRGKEGLVNGRMVAGDYVIESVAAKYVFRLGKDRATARRQPATKAP